MPKVCNYVSGTSCESCLKYFLSSWWHCIHIHVSCAYLAKYSAKHLHFILVCPGILYNCVPKAIVCMMFLYIYCC
uniref:Uncharacterized protein n=1 Tax=Triticum urartu TaxID=4572 RepID=A0A8R7QQF9_TRIUA